LWSCPWLWPWPCSKSSKKADRISSKNIHACYVHILPWNKKRPRILAIRPAPPVIRTMTGFVIGSIWMNRWIASIRIVKHSANKKTPTVRRMNKSKWVQWWHPFYYLTIQ
jgi:hypothetical protein